MTHKCVRCQRWKPNEKIDSDVSQFCPIKRIAQNACVSCVSMTKSLALRGYQVPVLVIGEHREFISMVRTVISVRSAVADSEGEAEHQETPAD